jgi:hypothetical protein
MASYLRYICTFGIWSMKLTPFLVIVFSLLKILSLFAQTDLLHIHWNVNPEPDMKEYRLFRSVNNLTNFQLLQTVPHPDSLAVDKNQIVPGNLYAYTLCAVDSAGNQSKNSDTVSVGLPQINWTLSGISSGEITSIPLNSFLSDPDNSIMQLQLKVVNTSHLGATIVDGSLNITPDPSNFIGTGQMDLIVTDPVGFWDAEYDINLAIIQNSPMALEPLNTGIPIHYELSQNYPNPFNPVTHIKFGIPQASPVKIEIFNLLGQRVDIILDTFLASGYYVINYNASDLPSGIYLYRLESDGFTEIKRMVLLK